MIRGTESSQSITPLTLEPLSDRDFFGRFDSDRKAAVWASTVRHRAIPGVLDATSAFRTAAVFCDPEQGDLELIERLLFEIDCPLVIDGSSRQIKIPVHYDGADLEGIARRVGLTAAEVIRLHASTTFDVAAIGFLPGFPYAVTLPKPLAGLPRRQIPRTRVPAGSVAIVDHQTCVYPIESPGGWHLLGRTPVRIADLTTSWFPIQAGDRLQFQPIDFVRFRELEGSRLVI